MDSLLLEKSTSVLVPFLKTTVFYSILWETQEFDIFTKLYWLRYNIPNWNQCRTLHFQIEKLTKTILKEKSSSHLFWRRKNSPFLIDFKWMEFTNKDLVQYLRSLLVSKVFDKLVSCNIMLQLQLPLMYSGLNHCRNLQPINLLIS